MPSKSIVKKKVEVLPAPRMTQVLRIEDILADLESIKRQVVKASAASVVEQEDGELGTWFRPRPIADEMKRSQGNLERRKWAAYFEKWGCVICEAKDRPHTGNGMCSTCRIRTLKRLQRIMGELEKQQTS